MKNLNTFNKILIGIFALLAFLLTYKIIVYNASERFYYITGVSAPKEFPINISGIWFLLPNGDHASASFHKTKENINEFYTEWGLSGYDNAYKPQFLPKSLFLEYIDFRTKNYYMDTISLPKKEMKEAFNEAKQNNSLEDLALGSSKMGLEFHVGIANDGNIIFWLIGHKWEKEFYRTQIHPKSFPKKMMAFADEEEIENKEEYITDLFKELPDSIQIQLRETKTNAQYKDSIPVYFHNLQK